MSSSCAKDQPRCDVYGALRTYFHDGGAIIRNRLLAIAVYHQQITTVRTKGAFYSALHGETGIDVGDDLAFAL